MKQRTHSLPEMDFSDGFSTIGRSTTRSAAVDPFSPLEPRMTHVAPEDRLLSSYSNSQPHNWNTQETRSSFWFAPNSNAPSQSSPRKGKDGLTLDQLTKQPKTRETRHVKSAQFSVLHAAAISGDKVSLQKLAAANFCDINLGDKFGRTPLTFAVLGNYPECLEVILKWGGKVELSDRSGRSSLHWAAHHGHFPCLKVLLQYYNKRRIPYTEQDQSGVSVLHLATRKPETKCLPLLLKFWNSEVDVLDRNQRTPLHWAASRGNFEYVRLLLKRGAKVEVNDVEGKTPLHWAVSSGSVCQEEVKNSYQNAVKTIQLLLQNSSSALNWQDYEGRVPLHLAVADSNAVEVIRALLADSRCQINALDNNNRSVLHWAAVLDRAQVCSLLLDLNCVLHSCTDTYGATPLHYAVKAGAVNAVETLMRRPDMLDLPDLSGRTSLLWASTEKSLVTTTLLKTLVRHGSKLDHQDRRGWTALHLAVCTRNTIAVETLLQLGGDVAATDLEGRNCLSLAASLGHDSEAEILLRITLKDKKKKFEEIALADRLGRFPLHLACQGGHASFVQLLLFHMGKNFTDLVDSPDIYGRSALIMSAFGGYTQCIKLLLEKGANIKQRDNEDMDCLHWAVLRGHLDAVRLLVENGAEINNVARVRKEEKLIRFTPLDSALINEYQEISNYMKSRNASTFFSIGKSAAILIQARFRGFRIRKSFNEHKTLLVKHEKMRAQKLAGNSTKLKETVEKQDRKSALSTSRAHLAALESAGSFLGHVVEQTHKSTLRRRKSLRRNSTREDPQFFSSSLSGSLTREEIRSALSGLISPPSSRVSNSFTTKNNTLSKDPIPTTLSDLPLSAVTGRRPISTEVNPLINISTEVDNQSSGGDHKYSYNNL